MREYLTSFEKAARSVLTVDEGIRYCPYKDTKGNWTIGVGHFIGPILEKFTLDFETIMFILMKDIGNKVDFLHAIFGEEFYESLPRARQLALLSVAFSMSPEAFEGFREMIAAIKKLDWDSAARELLDSDWQHDVNPRHKEAGRDIRLAFMLKTGNYHSAYDL